LGAGIAGRLFLIFFKTMIDARRWSRFFKVDLVATLDSNDGSDLLFFLEQAIGSGWKNVIGNNRKNEKQRTDYVLDRIW
jgi:hypothetical protein